MKGIKLKNFILNTLFPQFCLGCSKEGDLICKDCLSIIDITEFQYCPFCSFPNRVIDKGKCSTHQQMKLDGLFSATSYKNPLVKKMITHFKYKPCLKSLASPLASLIMSHFLLSGKEAIFQQKENCFFVPVPLNPRKKRQRGFNQSELLAKELAKSLKIPCEFNVLVKIKKTKSQTELKRVERAENIKGSFAVSDKTKNGLTIQGKTIFLIDDVFTTGSTMEECARILKQANALSVWGITIAREPLDG